jgi:hypothetical protein
MVAPIKSDADAGTWAAIFRDARGGMTQEEAAKTLSGRGPKERCPVSTLRDWEQGRREPPTWMQWLIIGQLWRAAAKPKSK